MISSTGGLDSADGGIEKSRGNRGILNGLSPCLISKALDVWLVGERRCISSVSNLTTEAQLVFDRLGFLRTV